MSEEEKEAIIFAEHFIKDDEGVFAMGKKETQTLLTLIEKQQNKIKNVKNIIDSCSVNLRPEDFWQISKILEILENPQEQYITNLTVEEQSRLITELQEKLFPVGTILFIPDNMFPTGEWERVEGSLSYWKRIK